VWQNPCDAVILGAAIVEARAAEVIHAHPSPAELVVEAADALLGAPLHSL
jgi:hypothetical protein